MTLRATLLPLWAMLLAPAAAPALVVPLGCGSYSTTVPAGYGGPLAVPANPMVTAAFTQQPASHKWWQTFMWKNQGVTGQLIGEQMTAKPWSYKPYANGLGMAYVTVGQVSSGNVNYAYADDLYVGLSGLNSPATKVESYSDWAVTAQWNDGVNIMNATLGNGFPYSYFTKVAGSSARVSFTAAVTVVSNAAGVLIAATNGHTYGIYGPSGSTWVQAGQVFSNTLVGTLGSNYFSVAILPDSSAATQALFLSSAYAFVTGTTVSWSYNQATAALTSTFSLQTVAKEQGQTLAMQALFRHQWKWYTGASTGLSYWGPKLGPKGEMKLIRSNSFSYTLPFYGLLPALPNNGSFDQATLYGYVDCSYSNVLAPNTNSFCGNILATVQDTYNEGHMLNKATDLVWLADQVGHTAARAAFLNAVETRLNDWFDATGNTVPDYYYDANWHCLIGYPSGFGSGEYINDHHFHSAYWIRAMATVARFDPAWFSGCHNGMASMLINNVANADRASTQFPFLRCYAPYEGHSWASGADGNNEESSSEDMQLCSALIQLGSTTGNTAMRDLGIFMYVNTAQAVEQYWFDVDDQIFPAAYAKLAVGQVWRNGYLYGTYFSGDPSAVVGIQLIPEYAGAASYFGRFPARLQAAIAQMGKPTLTTLFPEIFIMAESLYNPPQAVADFNAFAPGGAEGGGESLAFDYHWVKFFECAGALSPVTADWPNANVFLNGTKKTYCAFNPGAAPLTVNFSDGFSMTVAPGANVAVGGLCGSPTPTPTVAMGTRTPTPTPSRTASPSPSRTPSPSPTPPLSPSGTSSPSPVPSSSLTPAPSLSPSPAPSLSPSPAPSATATPSGPASATPSPSLSATPAATGTRSASPSVTQTAPGTFTYSPSTTRSATLSPAPSATGTPSLSTTPSQALTPSPTATPSPSHSATSSPSRTPEPTATLAQTPGATATCSATPGGMPSLTATLARSGRHGRPLPRQVSAAPNPQSGPSLSVALNLKSDADSLQIRVFTKAMTLIQVGELKGPFPEGWNLASLPWEAPPSPGLYYVIVSASNDLGRETQDGICKVFVLE